MRSIFNKLKPKPKDDSYKLTFQQLNKQYYENCALNSVKPSANVTKKLKKCLKKNFKGSESWKLSFKKQGLGDDHFKVILTTFLSGALPLLGVVNLAGNKISDASLPSLSSILSSSALKNLRTLDLSSNNLSQTAVSELSSIQRQNLPDLKIIFPKGLESTSFSSKPTSPTQIELPTNEVRHSSPPKRTAEPVKSSEPILEATELTQNPKVETLEATKEVVENPTTLVLNMSADSADKSINVENISTLSAFNSPTMEPASSTLNEPQSPLHVNTAKRLQFNEDEISSKRGKPKSPTAPPKPYTSSICMDIPERFEYHHSYETPSSSLPSAQIPTADIPLPPASLLSFSSSSNLSIMRFASISSISLTRCSLSDAMISEIRAFPPSLLYLDISFNSLQYPSPILFSNLPQLIYLNARNNRLRSLEFLSNCCGQLEQLDVSNNSITVIYGIEHMQKLCILDVSGNKIAKTVDLRALSMNHSLKHFAIINNPVTVLHNVEGIKMFVKNLNPSIEKFNNKSLATLKSSKQNLSIPTVKPPRNMVAKIPMEKLSPPITPSKHKENQGETPSRSPNKRQKGKHQPFKGMPNPLHKERLDFNTNIHGEPSCQLSPQAMVNKLQRRVTLNAKREVGEALASLKM